MLISNYITVRSKRNCALPRRNKSNTGHPVERKLRHSSGEQWLFKICKAVKQAG